MTETTTQTPQPQGSTGAGTDTVDEQLAAQLVAQARAQGISLVGPDGLLQRMTKLVVEGALEGELTDHLGYQHGDPVGRNGGNSPGRHPRQDGADRGRPGRAGGATRPGRQLPATDRPQAPAAPCGRGGPGGVAGRQGPDHRRGGRAPGRDLRRRGVPADDLGDHRPGAGGPGGLAVPPPGPGLPGHLHRRHPGQAPRRAGRQPAHLRRAGGDL